MIFGMAVAFVLGFLLARRYAVYALVPVSLLAGLGAFLIGLAFLTLGQSLLTGVLSALVVQAGFLTAVLVPGRFVGSVRDDASGKPLSSDDATAPLEAGLPALNKRLEEMRDKLSKFGVRANKEDAA